MARVLDMPRGTTVGASAAAGSSCINDGDGLIVTRITTDTVLPAIAGGANLAVGKKLITFPAGVIRVYGAYMNLAITQTEGNIDADTPDGGLGTTIGSGAVAVLGGTAAFENILTGQTFNDCDGTAEVVQVATDLLIAAADSHDVYFNVADGWAASGDAGALLQGTCSILWSKLD